MRPRTPSELKALDGITALLTEDVKSWLEYLGENATAEELLDSVEQLRVFTDLLTDLRNHAAGARRKPKPKPKPAAKK